MTDRKTVQIWAIVNFLALAAVITINALASTLPLNGLDTGQLSDMYPNLFVPAGLTFSIWGLIYLLLAGFAVYGLSSAFSQNGYAEFLQKIGPWFLFSSAANIGWIFAWHWQKTVLSLLIMLVILFTLIVLYIRQYIGRERIGFRRALFTTVPFSVYLGWITVATIANVTTVLVNAGWFGGGLSEAFWTVLVIMAAVVITGLFLYIRRDWFYAAVPLWALLGIVLKRSDAGDAPGVVIAALVGMGVIIVFAVIMFNNHRASRR